MTLKEIGEFGFIHKISSGCLVRSDGVIRAIGDDAAAFTVPPGQLTLVTTDLLVERVHFLRDAASGADLGYKALAVNLSDIAAMGGTAREAFISIAIPENCPVDYLEDFYRGMRQLARRFDVNILGGDTTGSQADLIINISVIGSVPREELLCRDAAKPGDLVYVTGFLGDSRAGLHLILRKVTPDSEALNALLKAHIRPHPHLEEGRFLASQEGVHAAIDVSDGLSSDMGHIARQSGVGVRLHADQLPVSGNLREFCKRFDSDPADYALTGGEDYVLLCTIAPEQAETVARNFQKRFSRPLYSIGEVTDSGEVELLDRGGQVKEVCPSGWDHFKS